MSDDLTKEQKEELEKLQKEIASEAMHSVYFPIGKQAICMRFEQ